MGVYVYLLMFTFNLWVSMFSSNLWVSMFTDVYLQWVSMFTSGQGTLEPDVDTQRRAYGQVLIGPIDPGLLRAYLES